MRALVRRLERTLLGGLMTLAALLLERRLKRRKV
jgi:hypothetical protein